MHNEGEMHNEDEIHRVEINDPGPSSSSSSSYISRIFETPDEEPSKFFTSKSPQTHEDQNIDGSKCSKLCDKKCALKFKNLSPSSQHEFRLSFTGPLKETKRQLLLRFSHQEKLLENLSPTSLLFKREYFCIRFTSHITGVSEFVIKNLVRTALCGLEEKAHGNQGISRCAPKTVTFIAWIVSFTEAYGQSSPEDRCKILPAFLTKTSLFNLYKDENEMPHLSFSTFCEHLSNYFSGKRQYKFLPQIKFSSYSSHSKCDTCSLIEKYTASCKSKEQLDFLRGLKYLHREKFGKIRISIEIISRQALTFPEHHITIYIDGMDNSKEIVRKFILFILGC